MHKAQGRSLLDDWRSMLTVAAMPDLSRAAKLVYLRLLDHRNRADGRCNPSYPTLAKGAAITRRGAIDAVAELERKGLLTVTRGGGDPNASRGYASNSYVLFPPAGGEQIDTPPREESHTGGSEEKRTRGRILGRASPRAEISTPRGATSDTQTIEREPTNGNRRKEDNHIGPKADSVMSHSVNWVPSDDEVPF